MSRFLETLKNGPIVADGGMGSMLHQIAEASFRCTDELNLREPDSVLSVHVRFIRAGARLIETNTFGANRLKLRALGLEDQLLAINQRGVKLAREAREIAGADVFIAGSIGPTGHADPGARAELIEVFKEQATALDDRGVDLFVLETFTETWELEVAVEAVRAVTQLPIIAQLAPPAGDDWSEAGSDFDPFVQCQLNTLANLGVEVIGLNCSVGPAQILPTFRQLAATEHGPLLSVQPNSGLPFRQGGRYVYPRSSPAYYAWFAEQAVAAGARIVGGCCGTTPEQIEAMAAAIQNIDPSARVRAEPAAPRRAETEPRSTERSELSRRLERGDFVVSVQVDPPKGCGTDMVIEACTQFKESGKVDVVDVNSNPMARLHMDALWMSAMIEKLGMETIPHYTPRDASLMGIEGNLLGAWNTGVRNVLVITGDPSMVKGEPGGSDVYQTDSIGLVRAISDLNTGVDCFGNRIGSPPNFNIGVAVNPNHDDLDLEADRFFKKVEAGANFAMTQVFFEFGCWERFLERIGGKSPIPILIAVWPLTSYRLALRIHNEVPGIVVPDDVLSRLERAGPKARREGFALAREILQESRNRAEGVYIIAPFKRPTAALELLTD